MQAHLNNNNKYFKILDCKIYLPNEEIDEINNFIIEFENKKYLMDNSNFNDDLMSIIVRICFNATLRNFVNKFKTGKILEYNVKENLLDNIETLTL